MTVNDIQAIVKKYVDAWNAVPNRLPMWVILALPGEALAIPGVTFGASEQLCAGMQLPVRAHLIALHKGMKPESILCTFLHEYGHALYRVAHSESFDHIDSEIAAILHSLEALTNEGLADLARQEAKAVITMGSSEPYASAIQRLAAEPLWRTYSQ